MAAESDREVFIGFQPASFGNDPRIVFGHFTELLSVEHTKLNQVHDDGGSTARAPSSQLATSLSRVSAAFHRKTRKRTRG